MLEKLDVNAGIETQCCAFSMNLIALLLVRKITCIVVGLKGSINKKVHFSTATFITIIMTIPQTAELVSFVRYIPLWLRNTLL